MRRGGNPALLEDASRVPGDEKHPEFRSHVHEPLGEIHSVQPRQHDIGDQQIDPPAIAGADRQRLLAGRRRSTV
jgi:hypothetical protein